MTRVAFSRLFDVVAEVAPVEGDWRVRAEARLASLTKPPGSLGRLEQIAAQLCAIQQTISPVTRPRRVVVFAADHGVAEEGTSAYPRAVTAQMVSNFAAGGAAISALARRAEADVLVVDVGVLDEAPAGGRHAAILHRRIRRGTRNMTLEPAMTAAELEAAIDVGLAVADAAAAEDVRVLVPGEMGIGNSTAASAITAAITKAAPETVTGRGTGIDDAGLARKCEAVARALRLHAGAGDPLDVLRTVGGLEIAAIAGACIGAARRRIAILGDGFIATAAVLIAASLCPAVLDYWIAAHRSPEPGHAVQLAWLGQTPLLALDMRLGEGTGAVLAVHLLDCAAAVMNEMATFESAGVSRT